MNIEPPELQTRIALVEQRLIARETRLGRGIYDLRQRGEQSLRPWRRALPVIGIAAVVAVAGLLLWRWRHPAPVHRSLRYEPKPVAQSEPGAPVPWVRLVPLAWPLVPARWRARVSPATAGTLAALVLPLLERVVRLAQRRR